MPGAAWQPGYGEVAYVSGGQLHLLSRDGTVRRVAGPGAAHAPGWSAGGAWVAFLRSSPPPPSEPYQDEPATLWVARADGSGAHVVATGPAGVASFAWSPAAGSETLAYTLDPTGPSSAATGGIWLARPTSTSTTRLLGGSRVFTFAWAPSGTELAAGVVPEAQEAGQLQVVPAAGGAPRTVYRTSGYVEVASWWPGGGGIVFWRDTAASASIAADGLPLESLDLTTGRATFLATTLVHAEWLVWSPDGKTLALVAGGDRSIWDDGKHVETCAVASGDCTAVIAPAGEMTLDPAWATNQELVVVRAPGSAANDFGPPPGCPACRSGGYSVSALTAWYGAQRLWALTSPGTDAGSASPITAGPGAHNPVATTEGEIYVRGGGLWFLGYRSATPLSLASGLGTPGPKGGLADSYYGYVDWAADFAWHA